VRKIFTLILCMTILLCGTGVAWSGTDIGSEQMDLTGSIETERQQDVLLMDFFSEVATNPATVGMPVVGLGVSVHSMFNKQVKSPPWFYYPLGRYRFDYSTDVSFFSFAVKGESATTAFIANIVFDLNKFLAYLGIQILTYAFNSNWMDSIIKYIVSPMNYIWYGDGGNKGLQAILLPLAVLMAVAYMTFRLAQKRIGDVFRAFIATSLVLAVTIIFFSNASPILSRVNGFADDLSGVFMSVVSPVYNPSDPTLASQVKTGRDKVLAGFMSTTWKTLVVSPWALGEFGTVNTSTLILTDQEYKNLSKGEFKYNGKDYFEKVQPGMRLDTLLLSQTSGSNGRQAIVNSLAKQEIDHGDHPQTIMTMAAGGKFECIKVAFFCLLGTISFFLLSLICAGSMVLAQFALAILILAAPFVAIFALIPEGGWSLGIKYTKFVMGGFGVKVFYGVFLSVVMVTADAAQRVTQGGVGGPIFVSAAVFAVALYFRKRIIEMMSETVVKGPGALSQRADSLVNREREKAGGSAKRWIAKAARYKYMANKIGGKNKGSKVLNKEPGEDKDNKAPGIEGAMKDFKNNEVSKHYEDNFEKTYGYKPVMGEKDKKVINKLTDKFPPEDINGRMDKWFQQKDNPKIFGKGDVDSFAKNIKKFEPPKTKQINGLKVVRKKGLNQKQPPNPIDTRNQDIVKHYQESFKNSFGKDPVIKDKIVAERASQGSPNSNIIPNNNVKPNNNKPYKKIRIK